MRHWLLAALLLLLENGTSLAAEEHHGGHGEDHGIPWLTLFFTAVNFGLFLLLVSRLALPAIRTWAITRHERIVDELNRAAAARAEAEALKAEWEARIATLDRVMAEIRNQALADAQRERERILQGAQATAAAIAADAEKAAAQEVRKAAAELGEQVAREASTIAREVIRENLTGADQKRFVDEFLREVRG